MMNDEDKKSVIKEKQLSGSQADGGIPFRVWDRNAQDDLREKGGGILAEHYLGVEIQMPLFCAPSSTFSWAENQCQETLHWNDEPVNGADGEAIVYTDLNPRWTKEMKQKEWMEFIAQVSTKSATRANAEPPKWNAAYCSLAWQSQLAHNRDEAVKNYCKKHTRKTARTWVDSCDKGLYMRAKLEEKSGAVGDSMAVQ